MRLTIDQIDKISQLKDRYHDAEVVEIDTGLALSLGWIHIVLEDGDEKTLIEGGISPTGELHT